MVSWEDTSSFVKKLEFNRLGVWEAGSACFEFELLSSGGVQVRMNMNAVKHLAERSITLLVVEEINTGMPIRHLVNDNSIGFLPEQRERNKSKCHC